MGQENYHSIQIYKLNGIYYVSGVAPDYSFLWTRQFILYQNFFLRSLFSPNLRRYVPSRKRSCYIKLSVIWNNNILYSYRFSISVLFVIIVAAMFLFTSYITTWVHDSYFVNDGYCYNRQSNANVWFIMGTVACLYFQSTKFKTLLSISQRIFSDNSEYFTEEYLILETV